MGQEGCLAVRDGHSARKLGRSTPHSSFLADRKLVFISGKVNEESIVVAAIVVWSDFEAVVEIQ